MRKFAGTAAAQLRWPHIGIVASALAALAIALATPATAAPSALDGNSGRTEHDVIADADGWLDNAGMTPYGTYQNDDPRKSASRR